MQPTTRFVDAPELKGFFAGGRFYPYVMGGAPDPSGEGKTGEAGSGGEEKKEPDPNATGGEEKKSDDDEKKFTQADVNALITKEVSKATRGKLDAKELGFESSKELKDFIETMKNKGEAEKTEQEKKLEEAIAAAKKEAEDGVLSKAHGLAVKSEFRVAAMDAGIPKERLDDAFALAQIHEDWNVEVNDKDEVTGLDEGFFKALKESKPYLFADDGGQQRPPGNAGAGAGGGAPDKDKAQTADLMQKYPSLANAAAMSGQGTDRK